MDRFWAKALADGTGCWPWQGPRQPKGYGHTRWRTRTTQAHRVAWECARGPIPDGQWVLHRCDNRLCINPDHLYLGTHADNMRDRTERVRTARGERHGRARLTEAKVRAIRVRAQQGESLTTLAREYGVHRRTIRSVLGRGTRPSWTWLSLSVLFGLGLAHAGEDCTTWCAPQFGPGVGVTCQAAVGETGECLRRCFYENGWWIDAGDGAVVRSPAPGEGDQRPRLVDVVPYGYASEFGYAAHAWGACPGSYFGSLSTPAQVWEWCQAVARGEYHEGEAWCSQWEAP